MANPKPSYRPEQSGHQPKGGSGFSHPTAPSFPGATGEGFDLSKYLIEPGQVGAPKQREADPPAVTPVLEGTRDRKGYLQGADDVFVPSGITIGDAAAPLRNRFEGIIATDNLRTIGDDADIPQATSAPAPDAVPNTAPTVETAAVPTVETPAVPTVKTADVPEVGATEVIADEPVGDPGGEEGDWVVNDLGESVFVPKVKKAPKTEGTTKPAAPVAPKPPVEDANKAAPQNRRAPQNRQAQQSRPWRNGFLGASSEQELYSTAPDPFGNPWTPWDEVVKDHIRGKGKVISFTGHRSLKNEKKTRAALERVIRDAIADGYRVFISGMAYGADMLAVDVLLELREEFPDIIIVGAVPVAKQTERWSVASKERYKKQLEQIDAYGLVSFGVYTGTKMNVRNTAMRDESDLIVAMYDGAFKGGTYNAVSAARKVGTPIVFIDPATGSTAGKLDVNVISQISDLVTALRRSVEYIEMLKDFQRVSPQEVIGWLSDRPMWDSATPEGTAALRIILGFARGMVAETRQQGIKNISDALLEIHDLGGSRVSRGITQRIYKSLGKPAQVAINSQIKMGLNEREKADANTPATEKATSAPPVSPSVAMASVVPADPSEVLWKKGDPTEQVEPESPLENDGPAADPITTMGKQRLASDLGVPVDSMSDEVALQIEKELSVATFAIATADLSQYKTLRELLNYATSEMRRLAPNKITYQDRTKAEDTAFELAIRRINDFARNQYEEYKANEASYAEARRSEPEPEEATSEDTPAIKMPLDGRSYRYENVEKVGVIPIDENNVNLTVFLQDGQKFVFEGISGYKQDPDPQAEGVMVGTIFKDGQKDTSITIVYAEEVSTPKEDTHQEDISNAFSQLEATLNEVYPLEFGSPEEFYEGVKKVALLKYNTAIPTRTGMSDAEVQLIAEMEEALREEAFAVYRAEADEATGGAEVRPADSLSNAMEDVAREEAQRESREAAMADPDDVDSYEQYLARQESGEADILELEDSMEMQEDGDEAPDWAWFRNKADYDAAVEKYLNETDMLGVARYLRTVGFPWWPDFNGDEDAYYQAVEAFKNSPSVNADLVDNKFVYLVWESTQLNESEDLNAAGTPEEALDMAQTAPAAPTAPFYDGDESDRIAVQAALDARIAAAEPKKERIIGTTASVMGEPKSTVNELGEVIEVAEAEPAAAAPVAAIEPAETLIPIRNLHKETISGSIPVAVAYIQDMSTMTTAKDLNRVGDAAARAYANSLTPNHPALMLIYGYYELVKRGRNLPEDIKEQGLTKMATGLMALYEMDITSDLYLRTLASLKLYMDEVSYEYLVSFVKDHSVPIEPAVAKSSAKQAAEVEVVNMGSLEAKAPKVGAQKSTAQPTGIPVYNPNDIDLIKKGSQTKLIPSVVTHWSPGNSSWTVARMLESYPRMPHLRIYEGLAYLQDRTGQTNPADTQDIKAGISSLSGAILCALEDYGVDAAIFTASWVFEAVTLKQKAAIQKLTAKMIRNSKDPAAQGVLPEILFDQATKMNYRRKIGDKTAETVWTETLEDLKPRNDLVGLLAERRNKLLTVANNEDLLTSIELLMEYIELKRQAVPALSAWAEDLQNVLETISDPNTNVMDLDLEKIEQKVQEMMRLIEEDKIQALTPDGTPTANSYADVVGKVPSEYNQRNIQRSRDRIVEEHEQTIIFDTDQEVEVEVPGFDGEGKPVLVKQKVIVHSEELKIAIAHTLRRFGYTNEEKYPELEIMLFKLFRLYRGWYSDLKGLWYGKHEKQPELEEKAFIAALNEMVVNLDEKGHVFAFIHQRSFLYNTLCFPLVIDMELADFLTANSGEGTSNPSNQTSREHIDYTVRQYRNKVEMDIAQRSDPNQATVLYNIIDAFAQTRPELRESSATGEPGLSVRSDQDLATLWQAFMIGDEIALAYNDNETLVNTGREDKERAVRAVQANHRHNTKYGRLTAYDNPRSLAEIIERVAIFNQLAGAAMGGLSATAILEKGEGLYKHNDAISIITEARKTAQYRDPDGGVIDPTTPESFLKVFSENRAMVNALMDAARVAGSSEGIRGVISRALDPNYVFGKNEDAASEPTGENQFFAALRGKIGRWSDIAVNLSTGDFWGNKRTAALWLKTYCMMMAEAHKNGRTQLDPQTLEQMWRNNPNGFINEAMQRDEGIAALRFATGTSIAGFNMFSAALSKLTPTAKWRVVFGFFVTFFGKYTTNALLRLIPMSSSLTYLLKMGVINPAVIATAGFIGKSEEAEGWVADTDLYVYGGHHKSKLDGFKMALLLDSLTIRNDLVIMAIIYIGISLLGIEPPDDEEEGSGKIYRWDEYKIGGETINQSWIWGDILKFAMPTVMAIKIAELENERGNNGNEIAMKVFKNGYYEVWDNNKWFRMAGIIDSINLFFTETEQAMIESEGSDIEVAEGDHLRNALMSFAIRRGITMFEMRFQREIYGESGLFGGAGDIDVSSTKIFSRSIHDEPDREEATTYFDAARRRDVKDSILGGLLYNIWSGYYMPQISAQRTGALRWDRPLLGNVEPNQQMWVDTLDVRTEDGVVVEYDPKNPQVYQHAVDTILPIIEDDTMTAQKIAANGMVFTYNARVAVDRVLTQSITDLEAARDERIDSGEFMVNGFDIPKINEARTAETELRNWTASEIKRIKDLQDKLWDDAIPYTATKMLRYRTTWRQTAVWKEGTPRAGESAPLSYARKRPDEVELRMYPVGDHKSSMFPWFTTVPERGDGTYDYRPVVSWWDDELSDPMIIDKYGRGYIIPAGLGEGEELVNLMTGNGAVGPNRTKDGSWVDKERYMFPLRAYTEEFPNRKKYERPNWDLIDPPYLTQNTKRKPKLLDEADYSGGGGGWGGGGGGGWSPRIYSNEANSINADRPPSMYGKTMNYTRFDYLRPSVETKGSREAYRREDF